MSDQNQRVNKSSVPIEVNRVGMDLTLSWGWKKSAFFVVFSLFWNIVTYGILGAIFFSQIKDFSSISVNYLIQNFNPAYIIAITHPTVGFITGYYALATSFNKSTITVNSKTIAVKASPFPLPRYNRSFESVGLNRIELEEYVAFTQNDNPVYRFRIIGFYENSRGPIRIVRGLYSKDMAFELIEKISRELGIRHSFNKSA